MRIGRFQMVIVIFAVIIGISLRIGRYYRNHQSSGRCLLTELSANEEECVRAISRFIVDGKQFKCRGRKVLDFGTLGERSESCEINSDLFGESRCVKWAEKAYKQRLWDESLSWHAYFFSRTPTHDIVIHNDVSERKVCLTYRDATHPANCERASVVMTFDIHGIIYEKFYVISDVHGARDTLIAMLTARKLIEFNGKRYKWIAWNVHLVLMGDYIHKGEHSDAVIQLLDRLQLEASAFASEIILLIGNHELSELTGLDVSTGRYKPRYGFFSSLKFMHSHDGVLFVHAGMTPEIMRSIYTGKDMNLEDEAFDRLSEWDSEAISTVNEQVSLYLSKLTPEAYSAKQFDNPVGKTLHAALWMQWLHHYNGKTGNENDWPYDKKKHLGKPYFCGDVEEVLEKTGCHTMVVGHYDPSSQEGMPQHCGIGDNNTGRKRLIFSDFGLYANYNPNNGVMLEIIGEHVWQVKRDKWTLINDS